VINSRRLDDLLPVVQRKAERMIAAARAEDIDLLVTSTYRDCASQNALYALGRTKPGKIVTNAKCGQSYHQYRVAFDVVPIEGGKAIWNNTALWKRVGALGKQFGLEWAGDWKTFKEYPHFQYTGGLTRKQLAAGMVPK
jgi:peptidoglycan L-alanyl-D-glutamate endopeptidase CwlK